MEALALDFMNFTHLLGNLKDEFLDACRNPFLRTGQARYELINGQFAIGLFVKLVVTPVELTASTPVDGKGGLRVIVDAVSRLQQSFGTQLLQGCLSFHHILCLDLLGWARVSIRANW